jgi:ankyrin repeat protein
MLSSSKKIITAKGVIMLDLINGIKARVKEQELYPLLDITKQLSEADGHQCNALMLAIAYDCSEDFLIRLIYSGINLDAVQNEGFTAFHLAIRKGCSCKVINAFLFMGINVDYPTPTGMTALMIAARYNKDPSITYALLNAGANHSLKERNGWDALSIASRFSTYEIVCALLLFGADVNTFQGQHYSPLMLALKNPDTRISKRLIENGADVNAQNDKGQTVQELFKQNCSDSELEDFINNPSIAQICANDHPIDLASIKTAVDDAVPSIEISSSTDSQLHFWGKCIIQIGQITIKNPCIYTCSHTQCKSSERKYSVDLDKILLSSQLTNEIKPSHTTFDKLEEVELHAFLLELVAQKDSKQSLTDQSYTLWFAGIFHRVFLQMENQSFITFELSKLIQAEYEPLHAKGKGFLLDTANRKLANSIAHKLRDLSFLCIQSQLQLSESEKTALANVLLSSILLLPPRFFSADWGWNPIQVIKSLDSSIIFPKWLIYTAFIENKMALESTQAKQNVEEAEIQVNDLIAQSVSFSILLEELNSNFILSEPYYQPLNDDCQYSFNLMSSCDSFTLTMDKTWTVSLDLQKNIQEKIKIYQLQLENGIPLRLINYPIERLQTEPVQAIIKDSFSYLDTSQCLKFFPIFSKAFDNLANKNDLQDVMALLNPSDNSVWERVLHKGETLPMVLTPIDTILQTKYKLSTSDSWSRLEPFYKRFFLLIPFMNWDRYFYLKKKAFKRIAQNPALSNDEIFNWFDFPDTDDLSFEKDKKDLLQKIQRALETHFGFKGNILNSDQQYSPEQAQKDSLLVSINKTLQIAGKTISSAKTLASGPTTQNTNNSGIIGFNDSKVWNDENSSFEEKWRHLFKATAPVGKAPKMCNIGLDFGTSFTKAAYFVDSNNKGIIKFGDSYFKQSVVYYCSDEQRLFFFKPNGKQTETIRYFKITLGENTIQVTSLKSQGSIATGLNNSFEKLCAIFFLANLLRFCTRQVSHIIGSPIDVNVTMGIPLLYDEKLQDKYNRVLHCATCLQDDDMLSMPINKLDSAVSEAEASYDPCLFSSDFDLNKTIPELFAEALFLINLNQFDVGYYLIVDIGGGTVDYALLEKTRDGRYPTKCFYYCPSGNVAPCGNEVRLAAAEKSIELYKELMNKHGRGYRECLTKAKRALMLTQSMNVRQLFFGGGARLDGTPYQRYIQLNCSDLFNRAGFEVSDLSPESFTNPFLTRSMDLSTDDKQRLVIATQLATPKIRDLKLMGSPASYNPNLVPPITRWEMPNPGYYK